MNSQKYGLQALTPIYGQVIQSAPAWSGPFTMPPVPPTQLPPKTQAQLTQDYYDKLINQIQGQAMLALTLL